MSSTDEPGVRNRHPLPTIPRFDTRERPCLSPPAVGYVLAAPIPTERNPDRGISVSLILIAVGAILTWAVTATVSGIDINTVGVILMIVGAAGLVLSLLFWSSWGGFRTTRTATTVVRDDALPR